MLTYSLEFDPNSHVTKVYSNLSIFLDANSFHVDQNLTKNKLQPNELSNLFCNVHDGLMLDLLCLIKKKRKEKKKHSKSL